ncbi:uncharacterized protein L969DRAFT_101074 [Mixia osmundae IAM 14324]|uniref:Mitochondrial carrier protein n=1 Tax=Mixia osmundae (strain CBS 9802 / IAM 14324 / JCM 22182 / KY 12970) TaxID=764103 RepID=G7DZA2_MIXOS|nr:uncharacterized protein L969DRAFT_101074 [Mixia osmundae IAM 14324]KEI42622.1 hypothetical protein L969DRAFT_101074 [Mixia osmundae IAM 14324]GAA95912.1 hypothetical protein E5Q_02570 [Mixia osmundae IAM 14324]
MLFAARLNSTAINFLRASVSFAPTSVRTGEASMRKTVLDRSAGHSTWSHLQGSESMIAGAGAGLVSAIVTCPLDVVKTKLQAQGFVQAGARGYHGLFGTLSRIWLEEGPRGLYRGLGPTVLGYLPTWAIYFTVYDRVKLAMAQNTQADENDWTAHITAAMVAGATGTICTNPLWVIKTRFMTQKVGEGEERYKHTLDAIQRMYKAEGWHGFYRGLVPSLIGVTHVAVQFPLYEHLKLVYRPADGSESPSRTILLCSSASKMVASIATYPHEILRTRLQIQKVGPKITRDGSALADHLATQQAKASNSYRGIVKTFQLIVREEGFRGFYRGLGVNLLRTVPSSAMTILTYEKLMWHLRDLSGSMNHH